MGKGLYDLARETLEYCINNVEDNFMVRWYSSNFYLIEGKYELALSEIDKAIAFDPTEHHNYRLKGDIYHIRGDLLWRKESIKGLWSQKMLGLS